MKAQEGCGMRLNMMTWQDVTPEDFSEAVNRAVCHVCAYVRYLVNMSRAYQSRQVETDASW